MRISGALLLITAQVNSTRLSITRSERASAEDDLIFGEISPPDWTLCLRATLEAARQQHRKKGGDTREREGEGEGEGVKSRADLTKNRKGCHKHRVFLTLEKWWARSSPRVSLRISNEDITEEAGDSHNEEHKGGQYFGPQEAQS